MNDLAAERLRRVHQALMALGAVLDRERAAVAAMRVDELSAITVEKQEAAARLKALIAAEPPSAGVNGLEPLRAEVRAASAQVSAQAQANALLLADVVEIVADKLGLRRDAGTYDARARRQQRVRAVVGRAL